MIKAFHGREGPPDAADAALSAGNRPTIYWHRTVARMIAGVRLLIRIQERKGQSIRPVLYLGRCLMNLLYFAKLPILFAE